MEMHERPQHCLFHFPSNHLISVHISYNQGGTDRAKKPHPLAAIFNIERHPQIQTLGGNLSKLQQMGPAFDEIKLGFLALSDLPVSFIYLGFNITLCFVPSVVMFCFVFFQKFRLPIGLHNSCISPTVGGTCKNSFTKHHD